MLHPSYTELMNVVNSEVEAGEQPVVNSRYSIVMATSKRAKSIIAGERPLVDGRGKKPLSIAVEELYKQKVRIVNEDEKMLEAEDRGEDVEGLLEQSQEMAGTETVDEEDVLTEEAAEEQEVIEEQEASKE